MPAIERGETWLAEVDGEIVGSLVVRAYYERAGYEHVGDVTVGPYTRARHERVGD